jgi:hypothetical protein
MVNGRNEVAYPYISGDYEQHDEGNEKLAGKAARIGQ